MPCFFCWEDHVEDIRIKNETSKKMECKDALSEKDGVQHLQIIHTSETNQRLRDGRGCSLLVKLMQDERQANPKWDVERHWDAMGAFKQFEELGKSAG